MPHELNLLCNVWDNAEPIPPVNPPRIAGLACFVKQARFEMSNFAITDSHPNLRLLYVSPRAALKVTPFGGDGDLIEVPAGSGQLHYIVDVQDIDRDLPTEERRAIISPTAWITQPIP